MSEYPNPDPTAIPEVYECPTHGYTEMAFTPSEWRFITGFHMLCDECNKPMMWHPELRAIPKDVTVQP